ncbi:hypothetical protein BJ508DRAFT_372340 [Ascobolus immersus RN42]|uniref:Uncharacterized protein n=1 Tax=Ascobolus immersus RN42 TaxID=1160509 RepID=A0A3N4J041_ASCIM|nr:hypothetical protein BJ508DRAFT_372340 [Ascobolus immersus RN42]
MDILPDVPQKRLSKTEQAIIKDTLITRQPVPMDEHFKRRASLYDPVVASQMQCKLPYFPKPHAVQILILNTHLRKTQKSDMGADIISEHELLESRRLSTSCKLASDAPTQIKWNVGKVDVQLAWPCIVHPITVNGPNAAYGRHIKCLHLMIFPNTTIGRSEDRLHVINQVEIPSRIIPTEAN